jgi:hypothetical protein
MLRLTRVLAALLILGPTLASAQSLAAVAKAEEARRKTVDQPAKVYTNTDLKPAAAPATPAAPSAEALAPAATTSPAAPAAAPTAPATASKSTAASQPAAPAQKDQAYWKARITNAKDALDRSRTFLDALQSRINALTTDFVNRDDPAQRALIEQDRNKALAELERVKKDIDEQTKAIAAIEEEARKAGVPPGWLR